jgi:multiphosphoryl transfer protein
MMIGIVLVSHSSELATAVKNLADQQTRGKVKIAAVGGTDDPQNPYGTNAMAILEAVQSVYSDDGVLVLMDLGSALLSTEMALEFLDEERQQHVRMSKAPFVEGAITAAVQASIGSNLETVEQEAAAALRAKGENAEPASIQETEVAASPVGPAEQEQEAVAIVKLSNPAGLHFRPAVPFVQTAAAWPVSLMVRNLTTGEGPADAKSFNQVLGLGAEQGHDIEIRARGKQPQDALDAMIALVESGFGETQEEKDIPDPAVREVANAASSIKGKGRQMLQGIPASPGVAIGVAFFPSDVAGQNKGTGDKTEVMPDEPDPDAQWARYEHAVGEAGKELNALARRLTGELGKEEAAIFQAHALLLKDPDFAAAVRSGILGHGHSAERAVTDAVSALVDRYRAMIGERFRERAADLQDIANRLLRILAGGMPRSLELPRASVIVTDDLAPSQTATLDRERVAAICTAGGGPTSHSAILARSLGIPAVVGLGGSVHDQISSGTLLAVDGTAGTIIVDPDEKTAAGYRTRRTEMAEARSAAQTAAKTPARTRDGHRVQVAANLLGPTEVQGALDAGAEGVGLLRTEFLFLDRAEPPTEDDQYIAYRQVIEAMAPRPVIIRTLDIGGDKPAPYLRMPLEKNPFLGWRAIRISLARPVFFKTQLRAVLRAAVNGNVKVMFPMVATLREIQQAKSLLKEAAKELEDAGASYDAGIPVGIMVEVPAVAEMADVVATAVDFFSIGSNDLTQYTFAADRNDTRVADLADPLHPAMLRQFHRVIQAAHSANRWVGLCGELAGDPQAIPILLGLGLDEFSMAADKIPPAKAMISRLSLSEAQNVAQDMLKLPDGDSVRSAIAEVIASLK